MRWMKWFSVICALAACGGSGDSEEVADASSSCAEAESHSDLDWIQDEIFTKSCSAFSSCHVGAAKQAGGLSLEGRENISGLLINVDSKLFQDWKLVVPGRPSDSYLMVILGGADGPLNEEVGTMPYNNPILCPEKIGAVRRWITGLGSSTSQ